MKKLSPGLVLVCSLIYTSAFTQQEKKPEDQIRQYWFVMLTAGNDRNQDSVAAAKIQEGHMANIKRLYNEGKLKVAGPFGDEGKWIGLFIFDCETKEEVEKLLKTGDSENYSLHK
jgi:uncharacterized protein YciI